jgi:hypothetical protein
VSRRSNRAAPIVRPWPDREQGAAPATLHRLLGGCKKIGRKPCRNTFLRVENHRNHVFFGLRQQ